MIDEKIAPAVSELYQWGVALWQDDYGKKSTDHKKHLMVIRHRIPYEHQAPKMADVWLIENVLTIIKQKTLKMNHWQLAAIPLLRKYTTTNLFQMN